MSYSRAVQHLAMHATGYTMNSPLLFGLLDRLRQQECSEILDPTPANQAFLQVMQQQHCRLYLPGCDESLLNMNPAEFDTENKLYRALAARLLLYKKQPARLDLILLWDLPNYLSPQVLSALVSFLRGHCHEQAQMHCYVHTRQKMPSLPAQFHFAEERKIRVDQRSEQTSASPMFYKESLQRLVAPFLIEKGMLLSNGLQEYLLRRRGG